MPAEALTRGEGNKKHGSGEDFSTMDEVRVFKDEGEDENEQFASESLQADLLEEKSSLINESEHFQRRPDVRAPLSAPTSFPNPFGMGYLVHPYAAYANSRSAFPHFPPPERLVSPPPAHMTPYDRPSLPGPVFPPSPYHPMHHQYGPYGSLGMDQLAAWHQVSMLQQRAQSPYSLPLSSGIPRFPSSEGFLPPHLLPPHHLPHIKPDHDQIPGLVNPDGKENHPAKKEPHIKKPLNAFMLYMKEMRPVVQAECTLKESAAINQILGRRWHGLAREEQAIYYEKAREERQRHQQMYPNWNARDNYRYGQKTKKRKRDKTDDPTANIKKCRARYGVEQPSLWCKPCKRKKKCIRVQMYLAGHTEQEIEETCTKTSTEGDLESGGIINGEGGSPASQGGSVEYNDHSLPSPSHSIPSLESPASIASPSTPGSSDDWMRTNEGYNPPAPSYRPVGSDPRDAKTPLSVSSWRPF